MRPKLNALNESSLPLPKKYLSRKSSYTVLFLINIVLAIVRLGIFDQQSLWFHVTVFIGTFGFFVLGWEILLWVHDYFEKLFPIAEKPVARILIQIVITAIIFSIFSNILFGSVSALFNLKIEPMLDKVLYLLNFLLAVIYNLTLFGTHYFYQWKYDLVGKTNLEKEQAVVKYDNLRNQLNPHFLFNALTSLNSLIFDNQKLASDFLQQLSKVYRYILQNNNKETVSLRTELDFAQHYIFLIKTRFANGIDIQMDVKTQDLDKGIVPVLSQMLVENAVKHNRVSEDRPLTILITSDGEYFIVTNNIIKKSQVESSNKLGMENVKSLYRYLTDKEIMIEESASRFTVRIPLI